MSGDGMDQPGMGLQMPRGRGRSGALHSEIDDEMSDDIERLNATLEGREPPAPKRSSLSGGSSAPELSRKTVRVLTDLKVATAAPGESSSAARREETEEEREERAAAEAERKRRAAEAASAAAAASASSVGGAGAAAGGAGSGAAAHGSSASGSGVAGVRPRKPADDKDYDVQIKLLLLGDGGVGKTSLMLRFSEDKFSSSLLSTAGVDYKTQHLEVDGKKVKLQIWDTAGQTRFHTITQAYYKAAHGIVLVYDVSDASEASFHNVRYWMDNITKHAGATTQRILIGNKCDVKGKKVDSARGKALGDEFHMRFWETSAKDGTNVREAFYTIARDIVGRMLAGEGGAGAAGAGPGGAAGAAGAAGGDAGAAGKGGKGGKDEKCTVM